MDLEYEEGLNIGIAHGIELGLKELVSKKIEKGKTLSQIVEELEISEEYIKK